MNLDVKEQNILVYGEIFLMVGIVNKNTSLRDRLNPYCIEEYQ